MAKKKSPTPPPASLDAIAEPVAAAESEKIMLAPISIRLMAIVYDGLLIVALCAIISAILVGIATPKAASAHNQTQVLSSNFRHFILFPAQVITTWLFYGYFWRQAGQTLGMQTWRLKVIKPDGRLLTWPDSFGRCAAAMILPAFCGLAGQAIYHHTSAFAISVLLGFIGNYLWAMINKRNLAWHDQLSGTVVIRLPKEQQPKRARLGWFSRD